MQPDLFVNIRQARQQLSKLKEEASVLQSQPQGNNNVNMNEYMKSVVYSLSKNDKSVDQKCEQYKSKLPSINPSKLGNDGNGAYLNSYKKYKKNMKNPSKKKIQQSTKAQHSFSFSIQNRQMKMHSHHQKHIKPDVSIEGQNSQFLIPSQLINLKDDLSQLGRNKISSHRKFRSSVQNKSQKKSLKFIDINRNAKLNDEFAQNLLKEGEGYNNAVDKYSKHEFMIINGQTASEGPEFASFVRIYESIYHKIRKQITKLQNMLSEKNVKFARFDGKKLAYLCLKEDVKKQELVDCLIDETGQLKGYLIPASKYMGKEGKLAAIVKIQSFFKMKGKETRFKILKQKTVTMQRFFKQKLLQLQLQKKIHARNTKILDNFSDRQDRLRSKWKQIKKGKRIQIHLNCLQVDEEKRLSIENFGERQNIQLSRIFRLKDENLIIIYISSMELPPQLINYYYRMLDLAGIPKYQDRLIFFTPREASIFPKHFSISKLLYYSSRTLKQLKVITQDLPTLLYPGHPTNQLIKICDFLECYLFSGDPQKLKPFTTRSQTIRFLKNLSIDCLPSAMEMYDYGQFLNTFSVLITKNPEISTWVLKIDDEFNGRGIAYLDISKSKIIQSFLRKVEYQDKDQFFTTDVQEEPHNQEITVRIRDYLKENLASKLKIATPTLYRQYEQFMGKFIKKGGIIQAKPPLQNKSTLSSPSISFCVEPSGEFNIIATYDKIIGSPYRSYACSFPQKSIEMNKAESIIRQICESFKLRKIFGYFTLDLLCHRDDKTKKQTLWVLDLDPYINDYTASFFLFDILMNGSYFPDKNLYLVENQIQQKLSALSINTMSSEGHSSKTQNISERSYTFVPHFFNPNLCKLKIKQFFKRARLEQFNFDISRKQGLCILLLDQLTSGVMSLLTVSGQEYDTICLMRKVIQFVVRLSSVKNVDYGHTDCEPSTDKINIKDMLSLFISLMRKDERKNAKQKAIREHEMNGKLQFIC